MYPALASIKSLTINIALQYLTQSGDNQTPVFVLCVGLSKIYSCEFVEVSCNNYIKEKRKMGWSKTKYQRKKEAESLYLGDCRLALMCKPWQTMAIFLHYLLP